MYESGVTFLVIYCAWVGVGYLAERFAPRLLDKIGDWVAR